MDEPIGIASGWWASDRRQDALMRSIVQYCRPGLEERGFQLEGRGGSDERCWVRFGRPGRDAGGHRGTLVLLVAHGRPEHALLFDAYFVDTALDVHTPRTKLLHWDDGDSALPSLVREAVAHISDWAS